MIETFTIDLNSLFDNEDGDISQIIKQNELDYYEQITPALNNLKKTPSDEAVNKILAFSKGL